MADLLHSNVSISFNFSFLSPPHNLIPDRHLSFVRLSHLNRSRFSHSSLLARFSSVSSQFDIISRTENSDGSVSFKFGDASEISQNVDGSDTGNEVDVVREDNEILDNQGDVVADISIDEESVTNGAKLKEIVEERVDSESDAQSLSTAEVENLSDSGEDDEVNDGSTSVAGVENSIDSVEDDEMESDSNLSAELENLSDPILIAEADNLSDSVEDELNRNLNSAAVVEALSDSVEEKLTRDSNSIAAIQNLSDLVNDELIVDSTTTVQVENLGECAEDSTLTAEVENSSDSVEEKLKSDSISTAEVVNSSAIDTTKHESQILDNIVSTCDSSVVVTEKRSQVGEASEEMSDKIIIEKAGELTEASAKMSGVDKLESSGLQFTMITETSHSVEEQVVEEVEDAVTSDESEAEQTLEKENEDTVTSKQFKVEPIVKEETSSVSLDGAVFLGSNEVSLADYPSIAKLNVQRTHHTSKAAPLGVEASGVISTETTLDSLSKEGSLAPAISISSAVASLTHSLEALTGGKDASFVSNNWFGVADGVGQWSFKGVDIGLYAHKFMQNCENILKSGSAGSINVKELLQQSAAMTQSTGSARVLIAHVANQVLHVANIGDSGFVIIRNGTIFRKSSPMVHEFGFPYAIGLGDDSVEDAEEYHIDLEEGDVIVTATDGLFDNLYEQEITSIVSTSLEAGMHVQDLAKLLASKAQEVGRSESARSPYADAAQAAGHPGFSGGKFDHVTVIVSLVQR